MIEATRIREEWQKISNCVVLFHLRRFQDNVPAIFLYLFKCLYFALSAYQVRCGYPTRILGNFLTKDFTLTNVVLFQA